MTRHVGDSVTIGARVVALLWRRGGLRELRLRYRGQDPELDGILDDLAFIAERWMRGSDNATLADAGLAPGIDLEHEVTVAQAAEALGVTPAAVRKAIKEKRLPANRIGGLWFITRADLAEYMRPKDSDE